MKNSKPMSFGIAASLLMTFSSCRETPAPETQTNQVTETVKADTEKRYPEAFEKALQAHGGLSQFKEYKSLEYNLENWPFSKKAPLSDLQRVDLKTRKVLIEGDGYRLGYNGDEVWVEHPKALGTSAEFYYATPYYFSLVPFVFTDPGAILEDQGSVTFKEGEFHAIKVTYESGTGDSPEDYYILYLDPQSFEVKMMSYIVSFPAFRNGKAVTELEPHVIVYRDFQEVQGLKMPHSFAFYNWNEGNINLEETPRGEAVFSQMRLSKEAFPERIFQKTE